MSSTLHNPTGTGLTAAANGFRTKQRPTHNGVDLKAAKGRTIRAAHDGTVRTGTGHKSAGTWVELDGADGLMSGYSHLSHVSVKAGQRVKRGDVIGKAGDTGNAKGAHLHFYVKRSRRYVDPMPLFASSSKPKPSKPKPSKGRVLVMGTWDDPEVGELQRVLNAWYPWKRPLLRVDNDYGTRTRARVMWHQQRAGLTVDGEAGDETLGSLGIR